LFAFNITSEQITNKIPNTIPTLGFLSNSENFPKYNLLLGSDCLSWYVSDASFITAKYLAKVKDKTEKDRGAPGIYHKMIQTWVTYELVKVMYLYCLNPELNDHIETYAPNIDTHIHHLRFLEEDMEDKAREIHELLQDCTLHTGVLKNALLQRCKK
jgi:hypothetical protein